MTKRSASKQREQAVYFVDRSFGPTETCDVIQILRGGGMLAEAHDTHFPDYAPKDPEWLRFIAERRWVGLTTDKDMKTLSDAAVHALMLYKAKALVCIGGRNDFPRIARNVVNSRHKMDQFVHKHRRKAAFVARLYMATAGEMERGKGGAINMYITYAQWRAR